MVNALYLSQFSDQVFPAVNLCKHFLILHHKNMFIEGKNILLIFFECVLLLSPVHNASWLLHGVPSFQTLDLKAKKDTKEKYAQKTIWWLDKGSLFLRIYGPRQNCDQYKDKKRTKLMSNHLDPDKLGQQRIYCAAKRFGLLRVRNDLSIFELCERKPTVMPCACFSFHKLKIDMIW